MKRKIFHTWAPPVASLLPFIAGSILTAESAYAGGKADPLLSKVYLDQLEARDNDTQVLEADAWVGYDLHKLWLKTEIERENEHGNYETESAELQALYSRAVAPYWDLQIGLRKDLEPDTNRHWGVIGFQGIAPYNFEVDTALFVGESGRTGLRLEAEYELLFTQRLILSPQVEINLYGHNDKETGVGSGLSEVEAGLRLRYEIRREFAPYIGVNWTELFGQTADYAKQHGEDTRDWQWVLGVRAWF
ncbi:copper resistance protein B [Pseudomaricurvus sp.]|uniref:copper resistance protein B n=1 Tax=Pseudomaricurvus sp. TaxID=2004510 RepID=UPI003F6AA3F0